MPTSRGRRPIPRVVDAIQQHVDMKHMPGSMASVVWTYGMLQPSVGLRVPEFFWGGGGSKRSGCRWCLDS